MDVSYLEIRGGAPLRGKLEVQGSKNAVLPVLAACLLGDGPCIIENCPSIGDVTDTLGIMKLLGCRVIREERKVSIDASKADKTEIGGAEAARIRSSILFLGALLGRMKTAALPLPGGCAIGQRPVDLHLGALEKLGASFRVEEKIMASARELRGGAVKLPIASVGATENVILASVQAEGETLIENAAREPEIDELCEFLNCRGARIRRLEGGDIRIIGVRDLKGVRYRMKADRIVTGTYLLAAAATGGQIEIVNDGCSRLETPVKLLGQMGAEVACRNEAVFGWSGDVGCRDKAVFGWDGDVACRGADVIYRDAEKTVSGERERSCGEKGNSGREGVSVSSGGILRCLPRVETAPYPGFPTDLQSPLMAALVRAQGESRIRETIFENRFRTAAELKKMGADIAVEGQWARIRGVKRLRPAVLEAPDLRGGAALVIAALQAEGTTVIRGIGYIERGYEDISRDLRALGADIRRCGREDDR